MLRPVNDHSDVTYTWRGSITDDEMLELVESHGDNPVAGWWAQVQPHSLGWVIARSSTDAKAALSGRVTDAEEEQPLGQPPALRRTR